MIQLKTVLAVNVKNRRKSLGLTQEELAGLVNTAPTYISMIESARRTPSFEMIEQIANALKVELPELFAIKGYSSGSTAKLREDLLRKFDQFLRTAIQEIAGK